MSVRWGAEKHVPGAVWERGELLESRDLYKISLLENVIMFWHGFLVVKNL